MSLCRFDYAVGGLLDILVECYAANLVGKDISRRGVLYVCNLSLNMCVEGGVFKHAVAVFSECAVFNYKVICIAQHLLTGDVASHES